MVEIPLDNLCIAASPRLAGINEDHVRLLADSLDPLPPILVQRTTMRVIDGMHRLRAAELTGKRKIRVQFFDGDDKESFIRAVAENVTHGLPLTLEERKAAATRVITLYPEWSDRAVAKATGLSGKTVALMRGEADEKVSQGDKRLGQDGRLRPVDSAHGRRLTAELLASRPDASLREIAAIAGVSPNTVRAVREQIRRGGGQAASRQCATGEAQHEGAVEAGSRFVSPEVEKDVRDQILDRLKRDPSIRYTEVGRTLLRWLHAQPVFGRPEELVDALPAHCLLVVARLASEYAQEWKVLAELLESKAHTSTA
ncbi:ParB/RepB/Spo0J family partition protein [Actinomadura yumaensis]|uniref:ParB/RepB/Spo0J family partition protein n=1 Tax=Actinomadura yumaensis TaxID=111807 RepID=UPI003623FFB5